MEAQSGLPDPSSITSVSHSVASNQGLATWSSTKLIPHRDGLSGLKAAVRAMREEAAAKFGAALEFEKAHGDAMPPADTAER
jgi:hypothetical protein